MHLATPRFTYIHPPTFEKTEIPLMRSHLVRRLLVVVALFSLAACGSDDDPAVEGSTTTVAAPATNTLDVEAVDYGYKIEGEVKPGVVTLSSRNTGKEIHMVGIGKLKAGKTVADVIAAGKTGGGGEGDPFEGVFDEEVDSPGHILLPGQQQSLTVSNVLDAGSYAVLCFIPTEGDGAPHFAKGMIAGFEVADGTSEAKEPEADSTITLGDESEPSGVPTDLKAGKHTFKVTSTGARGKDFVVATLQAGKTVKDFDTFFESEYEKEGGPSKGAATKAPGKVLGNTFEIQPGQSIWMTVELTAGDVYFNSATNPADDAGEDAKSVDKFVKVTVS